MRVRKYHGDLLVYVCIMSQDGSRRTRLRRQSLLVELGPVVSPGEKGASLSAQDSCSSQDFAHVLARLAQLEAQLSDGKQALF